MRYGMKKAGKAPEFAAGRQTNAPLPTDVIGRSLIVRLTGTLTVVGGTGAGGVRADAVAKLIDAVEIRAGNTPLQSWFGSSLIRAERYWEHQTTPQVLPADDTAAATDIDVQLRIPGYEPRSLTSDEKALALTVLPSPKLFITWGNAADIFNDASDLTSATLTNVSVEVFVETLEDVEAHARAFALPFVYSYATDVTQSAAGKRIELDNISPGTEIRAVMIEAEATGADAGGFEHSDDLLTNVKLHINGETEIDAPRAVMQADDVRTYGLAAVETGTVMIDAARDQRTERMGGQLYTVKGREAPALLLDVAKQAGDNRIRVTVIARKWANK